MYLHAAPNLPDCVPFLPFLQSLYKTAPHSHAVINPLSFICCPWLLDLSSTHYHFSLVLLIGPHCLTIDSFREGFVCFIPLHLKHLGQYLVQRGSWEELGRGTSMKEVMYSDGELVLRRVATLDLTPVLPLTGCVSLENNLASLRFAFLIYKVKMYCGDQKWLRHYTTLVIREDSLFQLVWIRVLNSGSDSLVALPLQTLKPAFLHLSNGYDH